METVSEDIATSSEAAANREVNDIVLQSDSNLKSGKDSDGSEKKASQPLDQEDDIDEDLLLCTSSDIEAFEDKHDVKEIKKKPPVGEKSEKYFSDIESSDNSQEYEEKKPVEKDAVVVDKGVIELAKEEKATDEVEIEEKHKESDKTTELELEPVESDEEEFDENLPVKKTEETQLEKVDEKEAAKVSNELEEISDKEDALSQEVVSDVATTIEENMEDKQNIDQSLSAESVDIPEEGESPSKCTLIDNKCEKTDDEEPQVTEGKALAVDNDPKEETKALEIKEKTNESSTELETKKEDAVPVPKVDDLEADKGEQGETNEPVELKESADVSPNPIAKETNEEIGKVIENTTEDGNKETDVKVLVIAETSEKLKESVDANLTEEVKGKEPEKSDESVLPNTEEVSKDPPASSSEALSSTEEVSKDPPASSSEALSSTEEVSKDPPASSSEALSSTSQPSEGLGSTSVEEIKSLDKNITPENTQKAIASPEEEAVCKETETISEKEDACGPKSPDIQTEGAPKSDKSDLGEAGKAEDKTEELAEDEEVLVVVEIESEAEDKGENDAETKEEKEETTAPEVLVEEVALESVPSSDENKAESDKVEPEAQATDQTKDVPSAPQPADETKPVDDKDNAPSKPDNTPNEIFSNENSYLKDKLTTKVSELMKTIDTSSLQGPTSDDDESLLVIDTTHKDDNENEDNDMDTETEQTVATGSTTDSSSDGSLEIFYDKECSNYDCQHGSKNFYRAPQFALSYYKVAKKRYKPQFVCEDCYDQALHEYEEMCVILKQRQPLYGANIKRQDFVEIIDSSDDEDTESNADNCKDENTFPKESIEFLEKELEGIIRNVMESVDIQNQLSWTKQVLQQSLDRVKEESSYVSEQLQQLQKKADKMHNSLYQCPSIKIRQLTPLDLNSGRSYSPESESTIPAIGEIERPSIQLNETYYAVKNKAIASWVPCKVVEEVEDSTSQAKNLKHFKIKFLKSKYPMLKTLSTKHMAYFDPPRVRLPIGTRVIAYFDASSLSRGKEKMLIPSAFYPGIIAEPLKTSNKYRYLVFYDDGYFQYVSYKDVRLVCHASENVWDDVHHQSREFIQNYLTQYAVNRPMVQTQKGQCMLVDYNGKWVYARVVDVDCSLVQMMFEGHSRSEWIYRGSTRLGPVYKESNNIAPKTSWNQSRISRRTEPFIRYFNDEDSSSSQQNPQSQQHQAKSGEVRSVAKKSVSRTEAAAGAQPVPVVKHLNNSTIFVDDDNKPKGKVVYYTARKNLPPRDFVSHICSPSCPFVITHNLQFYSPLAKPLLSGWERQVFRQKSKRFIVYRGPCGKRLRNMDELHRYLRVTNNELNVDNFDFSSETNCLAEYVIESCIVQKKDISNGEEKMPIPCVNYYDNTMPPDCKYSSRRIPTEGVHLNVDSDFLVGCDCEDDCSDKSKCSCWQLTYAGAKYSMPNVPNEMVGYQYKRLYAHVPTGIYECNSRCKCKANCVNRVVQQSLQSKLQVFKTSNRGWGLRCINDVPRGSFICIYAGHLLTEQKANEGGLDAGDEYFAELDYIEVAEQIKEGYESDVIEPDEEEDMYNPDKDDDDDEFIAPGDPHRNKSINTRLSTRRTTKNSSDAEHDSQERQVISFEPKKCQERPNSATERPTMRRLFGKDEGTYIMDAKITGNLGRYFNHSCSPNLFVQNVFVDTHDLRFPWVAFFAFSHIRAGTELTWNYNYEVGVVPGKVLYCQCGAPNCRQRLL